MVSWLALNAQSPTLLLAMVSPPNLTDQITKLRERDGGFLPADGEGPASRPRSARERRLAADWFLLFTYSLFAVAVIAQLALILWLDLF